MKLLSSLTVAMLIFPAMAHAETCDSYVGQTVTLNSFGSVASILKALPTTRGEYETTAAFEARVASARGTMPETVIIPGIFSSKYVSYDADTGVLKV